MNVNVDFLDGIVFLNDLINLDLTKKSYEQEFELKEDLFQVNFNDGYTIDLGWYNGGMDGTFKLFIVKDEDWGSPIWYKAFEDIMIINNALFEAMKVIKEERKNLNGKEGV